jgi:hypothetical protein
MDWLPDAFREGFCVSFARNISPTELMTRMGGDPETALSLTREEAEELEMDDPDAGAIIRFGEYVGWAFAIQSWGAHGLGHPTIERMSSLTEAVSLASLESGIKWLCYAVDGVVSCEFDMTLPHLKRGSQPERFDAAIERLGIGTVAAGRGLAAAGLQLITSELGADLPQDSVSSQPLPAARILG